MTDQSVISRPMIVTRRIFIALILVAILVGGGWLLYSRYFAAVAATPSFYGNVDIRDVSLGFRVSGRVAEMKVDEGDGVKAGQVLAILDKKPFLDNLALQKANVAQQSANVAKLEAGSRPEEIEQARADVAARQATLQNARGVFARQQQLSQRDFSSKQDFENAAAQLRSAEAQLKSSEAALKLAVDGPRKEDIAAGQAALSAARAQEQIAETSLADTDLVAPDGGVILTRAVEPGAIVAAGATVYTLSLQDPVWVRAYVGEPQLGLIHPGAAVKLFTDTRPGKPYDGQVGFISPVAEFTPKSVETPELRADLVYRFRVIVKNPDAALRQGMPVTVRLADDSAPPPATAK
jgi:HlyD family secretion protein